MRKLYFVISMALMVALSACSQKESIRSNPEPTAVKPEATAAQHEKTDNLVFVKGGKWVNTRSGFFGSEMTVPDFYIGAAEVTQKEWTEVMGSNPPMFKGDALPVEMVSWYDAVEYCNKRSQQEGLTPVYHIDKTKKDPNNKNENDSLKWTVTADTKADGYRLPTEVEWEYAAGGGQLSQSYLYSGGDNVDEVAWYWRNAGEQFLKGDWNWPVIENNHNQTKATRLKKPNELGLYDMSGNVREWCWNWYGQALETGSGAYRVVRGGGWIGDVSSNEVFYRGKFDANGFGPDQGFRVARSGE